MFLVSRDVTFYEHMFPSVLSDEDAVVDFPMATFSDMSHQNEEEISSSMQDEEHEPLEIHQDTNESMEELGNQGEDHRLTETIEIAPRTRQPPSYLKDYYCHTVAKNPTCRSLNLSTSLGMVYPIFNFVSYSHFSQKYQAYLAAKTNHEESKTYAQAVLQSEWHEAMVQELKAWEDNGTLEMAMLPERKKTVGCKWVYKVKYKASREIEKHKARLVAKGYTQVEGEDFNESFAPIAKMTTV